MLATGEGSILIVDDEIVTSKMLRQILEHAGFRTLECPTGEESLRMAASLQPEMILLDVQLPDLNGFEVCQRLKSSEVTAGIPVLFLTGSTDPSAAVQGFKAGGVDYIPKPFNGEELLARVRTHLELRRSRQRLEELLATKDKLFSIIAHDLRGPVGAISSILQTDYFSPETCGTPENQRMFNILKNTAEKSYQLLENLLDWARSQRGHWKAHPALTDLRTLLPQATGLVDYRCQEKGLTLTEDLGEEPFVFVDPKMLLTVVRNLLSNAVKFTPRGGEVTLEFRSWGDRGELRIRDTGVGIPPEILKNLMKPGRGGTMKGTEGEGGSGLGLILCQELMEKLGGTLTVDSLVGKGTTFYLNLPLVPEIL